MAEPSNVEYCFLQYVPNVASDRSVSIAAIFIDPKDPEKGIGVISIAADWQTKVRLIDPDSDLEVLEALLMEIRDRLLSEDRSSDMIRQLEDSFSSVLQVSQRRKCPSTLRLEAVEDFARRLFGKTSKPSPYFSSMQAPTCLVDL